MADAHRERLARTLQIADGGIVGDAFHQHCQRLQTPVLASPKRDRAPLPANLISRPVVKPTPL